MRRSVKEWVWAVAGVAWAASMVFAIGAGVAQAGGDAAKGRFVYLKYCASCHGNAGKGDGPVAAALNPKAKDLSNKAFIGSLKDDYLVKVIKEGGPAVGKAPVMPKLGGTLKDKEVEDVIAYIRSLAK